jgi:hypothetical protein
LLSGEAAETALASAPTLPDELPEMEKAWREWMVKLRS